MLRYSGSGERSQALCDENGARRRQKQQRGAAAEGPLPREDADVAEDEHAYQRSEGRPSGVGTFYVFVKEKKQS